MWRTKIWLEGQWLWFTSENEDESEAEEEVVDQAVDFYSKKYPNLDVNDSLLLVDDLEYIGDQKTLTSASG